MGLKDAEKQVDRAFTRDSYTGQSFENAFGGATSFLRLKYTKELNNVDLAITGIPFDQAVTNRPGSRFGPRAIREASTLQPFDPIYGWEDFDPMSEISMVDYGDIAFDYAKVSEFPQILGDHVNTILGKCSGCISLGGDHFISYPILKAYRKKFGMPLALLQFDAHSDTWPDDDMNRIDHGTMFYKAVKQGLIDPKNSVQVGIRTYNSDTLGVNIIDAREVFEIGPGKTAEKIKSILGDTPTYLTFDIDCLDPAYAPGTGTPVWGGLSSIQASIILRDLAGINMVGGDVVEVAPFFNNVRVKAKLKPQDITQVKEGQTARILLHSYDFTVYGTISGYVDEIAQNTSESDRGEIYYETWVESRNLKLSKSSIEPTILPGMLAQIEIIGEKRTIFEYLMKPVLKTTSRAFTEQ